MAYMHVFLLYTINYNLYVYYLFSDVWALYPRWGQERFFGPFRSNSMGCGRAGRAGGHIFKLYLNFVLACATSGKILQSFPPCWLLRLFPPVPWDDCCFLTALLIGLICLLHRVYKFASHHGGKF